MRRFFVVTILMIAAASTVCAQNSAAQPAQVEPGRSPHPPSQPMGQPPAAAQPAPVPSVSPAPVTQPAQSAPVPEPQGGFVMNLQNAGLNEVVDILARQLKLTYIIDPRVKGTVTINTFGEIKQVDAKALLETVLRINGAAIVQVGDIYRIVPVADVARLPVAPETEIKSFPDDERMMLNLVFLKYATVAELSKLLEPFLGEGARMISYDPANLLLILDNSRNMKRMMDLIATFDNDTLANKRVRLLETKNGRPSQLARELDSVMKAVSLGGEKATVKFLPIDRINTIVAIAPNPGVFDLVEVWLKKLDVPAKVSPGTTESHVYRVKYGQAETLASAIMRLYVGEMGGYGSGMNGYSGYNMLNSVGNSSMANTALNNAWVSRSNGANGVYGGGGGFGSSGTNGGGMAGFGGAGYGGGYGSYGTGAYGYGGGYGQAGAQAAPLSMPAGGASVPGAGTGSSADLTGSYLGAAGERAAMMANLPRVIPNPFANTILIHANEQDYAQILRLLEEMDVAPRQVLIEAKIYEVDLTGAFASGVQAWFQSRNAVNSGAPTTTALQGSLASAASGSVPLNLTAGWLVGHSHELLLALTATEGTTRTKVLSAPSLIATDSIPASISVGDSIPTLAAQVASGVQTGGTTDFAQSIVNQSTGVSLNVLAYPNQNGIITLVIDQQVSSPEATPANVNAPSTSPSFSQREVQTQVTVQDGDTIAIAGIITDSRLNSTNGIPFLDRIPGLGALFGSKSIQTSRTELVVFITPHLIRDTNQLVEATDQLKSNFKSLKNMMGE